MALLELFRKKSKTALAKPDISPLEQSIERVYQSTKTQISQGLSNPNSGTGRPIEELKGAAKFNAMLSNICGGSKANGGGGMAEGLERIFKHGQANGARTILVDSNRRKLKK